MTCATATASWTGEPSKPYVRRWNAAVELEQLGDDRPDAPARPQALVVGRPDPRPVRDVEADHRHVQPALEDAPRSLWIGPDVELGRRRHVALGDRRRP